MEQKCLLQQAFSQGAVEVAQRAFEQVCVVLRPIDVLRLGLYRVHQDGLIEQGMIRGTAERYRLLDNELKRRVDVVGTLQDQERGLHFQQSVEAVDGRPRLQADERIVDVRLRAVEHRLGD